MTPRFRMIAGPNGSGKTTLHRLLTDCYAVNFYTFLNADDMLAEARETGVLRVPLPLEGASLAAKLSASTFSDAALRPFSDGRIVLEDGFFRFGDSSAITSYTISFVAHALQHLDRAYFFDDSGLSMKYLAEYSATDGFAAKMPTDALPDWFLRYVLRKGILK